MLIGYPNLAALAAGAGITKKSGANDWTGIANLAGPELGFVARSYGLTADDCCLNIDFGADQVVRMLGIFGHNLSLNATVTFEIRSAADGGGSKLGGVTAVYAWPEIILEAGGARRPVSAEIAWLPPRWYAVLPAAVTGRYGWLSVSDATNPDGYVQFGLLWAGPGLEPSVNWVYGDTDIQAQHAAPNIETPSGAVYFGNGPKWREGSVHLSRLQRYDAFQIEDLAGRLGVDQMALLSLEHDTDCNTFRRSFLTRLSAMPAVKNPYYQHFDASFSFKEVAA